jgi:hypothetical protein
VNFFQGLLSTVIGLITLPVAVIFIIAPFIKWGVMADEGNIVAEKEENAAYKQIANMKITDNALSILAFMLPILIIPNNYFRIGWGVVYTLYTLGMAARRHEGFFAMVLGVLDDVRDDITMASAMLTGIWYLVSLFSGVTFASIVRRYFEQNENPWGQIGDSFASNPLVFISVICLLITIGRYVWQNFRMNGPGGGLLGAACYVLSLGAIVLLVMGEFARIFGVLPSTLLTVPIGLLLFWATWLVFTQNPAVFKSPRYLANMGFENAFIAGHLGMLVVLIGQSADMDYFAGLASGLWAFIFR